MIRRNFRGVCGRSIDDGYLLATRWSDKYAWGRDNMESFVLRLRDGRLEILLQHEGWLKDFWMSPGGQLHVTESRPGDNAMLRWHEDRGWRRVPVDLDVSGVFGLTDDWVVAWGGVGPDSGMIRWDGAEWTEMPSPRATVMNMHGISTDLVYAVGSSLVARWDGRAWQRMTVHTRGDLTNVFVVSADEAYACGSMQRIFEGSVHGWVERVWAPGTLFDVVKWNDRVLVAARALGLLELVDDQLVTITDEMQPIELHTSPAGPLLVLTEDALLETTDLEQWKTFPIDAFKSLLKGNPPRFSRRR